MFHQIDHKAAEQLMAESQVIAADIRSTDVYAASHIPGAINLHMTNLQQFCEQTPKDAAILLYCYHGISSQSVAQHLVEQGFINVYSLMGGFEAWYRNRYPIVGADQD